MQRFANLNEFQAALGEARKWQRVAEAVRRAGRVLPEVTYSIGDSLTYRVTTTPDCPELTGHRRYLEARYVLDGTAMIEVAPVAGLEPSDDYSDLTDRQHFTGSGERFDLGTDEIALIEEHEAVRDVAVGGRVVMLRVTVEG